MTSFVLGSSKTFSILHDYVIMTMTYVTLLSKSKIKKRNSKDKIKKNKNKIKSSSLFTTLTQSSNH